MMMLTGRFTPHIRAARYDAARDIDESFIGDKRRQQRACALRPLRSLMTAFPLVVSHFAISLDSETLLVALIKSFIARL